MLAENLENLVKKERLQGEQIGIQRGRMEGESRLLRKMIEIKFGAMPEWAESVLQSADSQQIDLWAESILTAESLEALLGKH
jgi:predicted transposase YdaD